MRVMSFNLRVDTPHDGEFRWTYRQPAVTSVWQRVEPDIIGTQEGSPRQLADLKRSFPEYNFVGVGRDADKSGEHVAIFYNKEKWRCLEHGNFWLSATPTIPGSRTFGNELPRHATWARIENDKEQRWFVINTHFDHKSETARQQSADMIRAFALSNANGDPLVITGDLNALPESITLHRLLQDNVLRDVFAEYGITGGTFHNYTGQGHRRIDYILVNEQAHIDHAAIVRDQPLGMWPSDHFPIYAQLKLTHNPTRV